MYVWLITAFEPIPSDRVRPMRYMGLADQLVAQGDQVTLFTTTFFHHTKSHRFERDTTHEINPDYKVVALRSWGYRKNVSLGRFVAHWHLGQRIRHYLPKLTRPDIILVALPPLSVASAAINYGISNNVPVAVDVIDPWPDVFLSYFPPATRPVANVLLLPFYHQAKKIMQKASALSALSSSYLEWGERLANRSVQPKDVFYPAVDISAYDKLASNMKPESRFAQGEKMRFVYAGALSQAYDVETVITCARILAEAGYNCAEFVIAGNGPKLHLLQEMAIGLSNVKLLGWLGAEDLAELLSTSHVGIACYGRKATQSITYKLFDYLAAGLPILSSLPGEMADIILREQVGRVYPAEDPEALAQVVRELANQPTLVNDMSRRARVFAENAGDSRNVYGRMAKFLHEAAHCSNVIPVNRMS